MGFLKKVFSKQAEEGQSLLNGQQQGTTDKAGEKILQRSPRITVTPLHNISFHLTEPFELPDIRIGNISSTGIGFLRDNMPEQLTDTDIYKGYLVHHDRDAKIETRYVHHTARILGCAFLREFEEIKKIIRRYFTIEMAAMDLAEVSHKVLRKLPEGTPHWFQKTGDCELYYVEDNGEILRFNVTFFGNYLEFEQGKKLVYGRIISEAPEFSGTMVGYRTADFVLIESTIPPEVVAGAVNFVMNIEGMAPRHKKFICEMLSVSG